jgi:hypothetical protein
MGAAKRSADEKSASKTSFGNTATRYSRHR